MRIVQALLVWLLGSAVLIAGFAVSPVVIRLVFRRGMPGARARLTMATAAATGIVVGIAALRWKIAPSLPELVAPLVALFLIPLIGLPAIAYKHGGPGNLPDAGAGAARPR